MISGLRSHVEEYLHEESTPHDVTEEVTERVEDVEEALMDNIDTLAPPSEEE